MDEPEEVEEQSIPDGGYNEDGDNTIVCLGEGIRHVIIDNLPQQQQNQGYTEMIMEGLSEVPKCERNIQADFQAYVDPLDGGGSGQSASVPAKAPRKKSDYQIHTGICMGGGKIKSFDQAPEVMKVCVAEWHEKKGDEKWRENLRKQDGF